MYYLGIYLNKDASGLSAYALVEKQLKNLKKQYAVIDVNEFPIGVRFSDIEEKIMTTIHDRSLLIVKKVFSQDRRPPKKVPAFPVAVCGFDPEKGNPFTPVRQKEIPVECVILSEDVTHQTKDAQLTLGDNHFVPRYHVLKTFSRVLNQKRFETDSTGFQSADRSFRNHILKARGNPAISLPDTPLLMAMAIPVWFAEHVRKIKRY